MTLTAPAQASAVLEQWSPGPFTAHISVVAGDVNGDGADDLVSFNTFNWCNKVLLSTGSAFLPQKNWGCDNSTFAGMGFRGNANLVGDMDGDGLADAVIVRLPNPRGIFVARSTTNIAGVKTFGPASNWLNNTIAGDYGTMTADLDADGDADVIGLFAGVAALAARSNGTASLPLTAWGPPLRGDKASLAADTTGDGAADFILVDTTGVRVVPANPRWFDTPAQWSTTHRSTAPGKPSPPTWTGTVSPTSSRSTTPTCRSCAPPARDIPPPNRGTRTRSSARRRHWPRTWMVTETPIWSR